MEHAKSGLRFEAPRPRTALRRRTVVAMACSSLLGIAASEALVAGSLIGFSLGVAGSATFAFLALEQWRRAEAKGSPLVLDEAGIHVDDGVGPPMEIAWAGVREIRVERVLGMRSVVVYMQSMEDAQVLPRSCHEGAPAEWLAGLLETFRYEMIRSRRTG